MRTGKKLEFDFITELLSNKTQDELIDALKKEYIYIDTDGIYTISFDKILERYDLGYLDMEKVLKDIKNEGGLI